VSTDDAPTGYSVRTATLDDAREMADLVNEVNMAEIGAPLTSAEEIRDELTTPERDEEDTVLLVAEDGTLAGYLELWADAEPFTEVQQLSFVRPALWGRGLSAWLLRFGEERARDKVHQAATASPVFLRVSRWTENEAAGRLFASLGYTYARAFYEMRMELDAPIPAPEIPEGIAIRTFDRDRDALAVHAALTEAFAEHWGRAMNVPPPFDRWLHEDIEGESSGFDAGLWFVGLDGEEVIGAVCCRASTPKAPDAGSVESLGVRSAWRGRGIGRALLLAAFGELQHRGIHAVDLGVDSENQTGATRLYEQVGMRIIRRAEWWEKEL
jgi:mycothiol synthase